MQILFGKEKRATGTPLAFNYYFLLPSFFSVNTILLSAQQFRNTTTFIVEITIRLPPKREKPVIRKTIVALNYS